MKDDIPTEQKYKKSSICVQPLEGSIHVITLLILNIYYYCNKQNYFWLT